MSGDFNPVWNSTSVFFFKIRIISYKNLWKLHTFKNKLFQFKSFLLDTPSTFNTLQHGQTCNSLNEQWTERRCILRSDNIRLILHINKLAEKRARIFHYLSQQIRHLSLIFRLLFTYLNRRKLKKTNFKTLTLSLGNVTYFCSVGKKKWC